MFWFCAALSATGVLESAICSCLVAEFAGYWLHRLLHSDKLPYLSRNHMAHHLLLYGPTQTMRSETYKDATNGRLSLGNVGLEWLVPSAVLFVFGWGLMFVFHIPAAYQAIVLGNLLVWPFFTFSFLHDAMHVRDSWLSGVPVVNVWFRRARRLHDIHHHSLNNAGRMNANFGIGFFLFDRIFRTFARRHRPLNTQGLSTALLRYSLVPPVHLQGDRTGEEGAAFQ
jgi:sterol desaturase/sphingolipid hydroxylase (fatty acid hydroxylase superfamily)